MILLAWLSHLVIEMTIGLSVVTRLLMALSCTSQTMTGTCSSSKVLCLRELFLFVRFKEQVDSCLIFLVFLSVHIVDLSAIKVVKLNVEVTEQ